MPTERQKANYLTILEKCKARRLKLHLQNELPEFLGVSLSTVKSFEKGELFDFFLLEDYAELCNYTIYMDLIEKPI